jgi:glycosyltransferase involved in cell wall biosynthesis/SAM-dependent methyltransferase
VAVDACTIVTRRELARARVLAATFHEHHPDAGFVVLVLDGVKGADAVAGARVVTLEEIAGSASGMLAAGNPQDALDAVVLPRLLRSLQGEQRRPLLYLAAGLRVLGPLDELESLLDEHELVLVSRAVAELGEPDQAFGARVGGGAISNRVLAISGGARAEGVLTAWPEYFVDGARAVYDWFDGIPAIGEDVAVLRDAGYGVDPYTLSASQVGNGAAPLRVDGRPVRIFDFSTLDPLAPERPNRARTDARLNSIPALDELRRRHAQELIAAGWTEDSKRAWRFAALRDGAHMGEVMRRLLLEGIAEGRLSESPYTERGLEEFYAYLNEPAERGAGAGLTRLHSEIWNIRADVQVAYPHLDGPDGPRFVSWLCMHGKVDHGLSEALLPALADFHQAGAAPKFDVREPLWGVNVAGFFSSELGLGEAARLLISGLDARGIPAMPVQAQLVPPCGQGAEFTYCAPEDAPYPISVMCINGDMMGPFAREVGDSFFEDRHTIALWWWEVGEFPKEWASAFEHVDEIWVGSQHIADAVAPACPVPVVKITMPVALPRVPRRSRSELGLPEDGFLFLYVHDYHSTAARKNPRGVVEAFKRAFPPGSGAKLVLKSINAENVLHEHDRVVLAAADHPDIKLIDEYVSAGDKNAMIAACDCYVSLHRSEGFGLTAAEAMLLGKPVIATRYGGNLEFMTEQNSYLIDWEPIEVGEDAHPYPPHAVWADPDLDQAAARMREVFDDPERARAKGEIGHRDVAARHAPGVAGEQIEARLRMIYERLVADGMRSLSLAHRPVLTDRKRSAFPYPELGGLIESEPAVQGSGALAALKRVSQRLISRLMRPFLSRQRAINSRLNDTIVRLDDHVQDVAEDLLEVARDLQRRQEARFAEGLAMSRRLGAGVRDAHVAADALERLHPDQRLRALEELDPKARLQALEELGRELEHHLAEHRAAPYVSEERGFSSWPEAVAGAVVGYRSNQPTSDERRYIEFEDTFRGPESRVREIQRAYLPLLSAHAPVLDVGCGRGELLDLLSEAGITASGVDLDAGMVEHSRAKGHDVALADGVEHLRGLPPASLGAVVALEVIEHIVYERLMEFLELARSRLRADGLLIFETVNPHAVAAMKTFWVDPTHCHPVFPEVALELCRLTGFAEAFWFHPTGGGEFEADRNSQPIYAVAARAGG